MYLKATARVMIIVRSTQSCRMESISYLPGWGLRVDNQYKYSPNPLVVPDTPILLTHKIFMEFLVLIVAAL